MKEINSIIYRGRVIIKYGYMGKKERILILSVDRDNDLELKTGIKGPVVGREECARAADRLAVADPEESDANAMFGAIKLFDELNGKYEARVAFLTGDKNVGIESDKKISEQLDVVLRKKPSDYALLVTDGSEDDHVIPIIQSKIPIVSVRRIIVRQAEQLESTYYKIKDFLKEAMENPKFTRMFFGLPALGFLVYAIFGTEAYRLIIGIVGVYFFIKGFKLEGYVSNALSELEFSFSRKRLAFFTYILAIITAIIATFRGYNSMMEWVNLGIFETFSAFIASSVYVYWVAGSLSWLGMNINVKNRSIPRIVSVLVFGLAISVVVYSASVLILEPDYSSINFIVSIILGFALLFIALLIEKKH